MTLSRRALLGSLPLLAAPAVITMPGLLMPVRPPLRRLIRYQLWTFDKEWSHAVGGLERFDLSNGVGELATWQVHGLDGDFGFFISREETYSRRQDIGPIGYVAKPPVPMPSFGGNRAAWIEPE